MPDDIQNEEGVDFSRYYDGQAQQIQKEAIMARNTATQQATKKRRTKIVVFVSIFVFLTVVEIGLLWYNTAGKNDTPQVTIPAGYKLVTPPGSFPRYELIKKK